MREERAAVLDGSSNFVGSQKLVDTVQGLDSRERSACRDRSDGSGYSGG